MHDSKWKTALRRRLLNWFDRHQRDLPWRRNKTLYRIWISEIMLQQTQVSTVVDYFNRFIKRFPSVRQLASAEESEVLKLWEGLGYYRRACQLHVAAKQIVAEHAGRFPTEFKTVLGLPGIGRYTAGAILSIAEDRRHPILEGNTIRLFARLLAMRSDPRSTANQAIQWEFSESLLPRKRIGDFNQALMELGSTICTPRQPNCMQCPLVNLCPTFESSLQDKIPVASKKIKYEDVCEAVVVVKRRNQYLVRKCGAGERWEGLWDFPRFSVDSENPIGELAEKLQESFGLSANIESTSKQIKHAVTKYRIQLDCYLASSVRGRTKTGQATEWISADRLEQIPMSVTGRKIVKWLATR